MHTFQAQLQAQLYPQKYEPEAEGKVEAVVYKLILHDADCGKVQCFQHEINK